MSEYTAAESEAYSIGYRIGVKMGKSSREFTKVNKEKWTDAYRAQIDELIKENSELYETLSKIRSYAQKQTNHDSDEALLWAQVVGFCPKEESNQ